MGKQDEFFKDHYLNEIPVENGILNIKTRILSPFSPKKIFFNKIPIVFDSDKKCENIDDFLKGILKQESDKEIVYELAGYSLLKKYNQYCKKHKVKGAGDKQIKATLEDLFGVIETRKTIATNDFERVWEGVKIKEKKKIDFLNSRIGEGIK